eukprot:CAMPEP_0181522488 /NCGR_PEP_ID=MMETSP1110-20121109/67398_1 /TAXON_ID=174948 /ORGANISM="Symbiodinium sp., Strain CCMP421" /LENGTH=45 /DNA_ID= /DNA_START= /DNA_END= /DNA_ORIENTATION=
MSAFAVLSGAHLVGVAQAVPQGGPSERRTALLRKALAEVRAAAKD